jgi:hypothetical protein
VRLANQLRGRGVGDTGGLRGRSICPLRNRVVDARWCGWLSFGCGGLGTQSIPSQAVTENRNRQQSYLPHALLPHLPPRRLRRTESLRSLVRETVLAPSQLVLPLFVRPGTGCACPVGSMAGCSRRRSTRWCATRPRRRRRSGRRAAVRDPEHKDETGSSAWDDEGPVQRAVRAIKREVPQLVVITDVCMCEYTSHGHCGVLVNGEGGQRSVARAARARGTVARTRRRRHRAPSDMMDRPRRARSGRRSTERDSPGRRS